MEKGKDQEGDKSGMNGAERKENLESCMFSQLVCRTVAIF